MSQAFDVTTVPLETGVNLIEASAGTGKTFSIAALFLRFVLEEEIPLKEILAVTYTVAATQELRERIRKRLREALSALRSAQEHGNASPLLAADEIVQRYVSGRDDLAPGLRLLDLAVQSFDEAQIFTIHGFCQRALQDYAFESGVRYEAETLLDPNELYDEIARDFWRRTFYQASPFIAALAVSHSDTSSSEPWKILLGKTRNHPHLTLFPRKTAPSSELSAQLLSDYATLRALWCDHQSALAAMVTDAGIFKKSYITPATRHLTTLPDLADEAPSSALLAALAHFTSDSLVEGTRAKKQTPSHPFFERCTVFIENVREYFTSLTHEFLEMAETELAQRKESRNILTFDDLLTRLHAGLQGARGNALRQTLAARYKVALIDEFQDTDPLQADIFTQLFAGGAHWLFLIGDPKQAIYGFRGADIYTYLKAADAAERHYSLNVNWRSAALLLDGFNAFFTQQDNPFLNERIDYHPVEAPSHKAREGTPPLEFRYIETEKPLSKAAASPLILEALVSDILHLRNGGEISPKPRLKEVAVLVRGHSQAARVQESLRAKGIHSVLHTDRSVFESEEAAHLQNLLEAVANYRNETIVRKALITPFLAYDAEALSELNTDESKREELLERFMEWHTLWHKKGFATLLRAIMTELQMHRQIVGKVGGERSLTNLLHLAELLHHEESQRKLTPDSLCSWLASQQAEAGGEAGQLRLESDEDAISIITIHKSKGLEYPYVFCPFLWEAADNPRRKGLWFHTGTDEMAHDMRDRKAAPQEHVEAHRKEVMEEELRLLYVALTRAKYRCTIYLGEFSGCQESPLGHHFGGALRSGVERLCREHPASISLRLQGQTILRDVAIPEGEVEAPALRAKVFEGRLSNTPFLTSFTSLVRWRLRADHERSIEVVEPEEVDEASLNDFPPTATATAEERKPSGIFLFEKGARAGDFFHELLEELDFTKPETISTLLPQKLQRYGYGDHPLAPALEAKLREVLEVELEPGLALRQIPVQQRLPEVAFSAHLPHLTVDRLKAIYSDYDGPIDLSTLTFPMIQGYLQGTIDLLFEHEGRYYLVDWKSNWLGGHPTDYELPQVQAQMSSHFYTLQAHLYLFALDQFLRNRLPDYDYERHFGGIFYLFIRGVDPDRPERSIYRERPPLSLVEAFRQLAPAISSPSSLC